MESVGRAYYEGLASEYLARRNLLMAALQTAGFQAVAPEGAYYILADYSAISDLPPPEFARWLTINGGIATVPGTSFFNRPEDGARLTRFAFCKTQEVLEAAARKLSALRA
jgi:aminotransferase